MQIEPQITFEGSEPSDAVRAQILSEIQRLETHNQRIAWLGDRPIGRRSQDKKSMR
jgi:chorismate-pyruvate lyase